MTRQELRSHYVVDQIVDKYKCARKTEPQFKIMVETTTEATHQQTDPVIDDRSYEQVNDVF